MTVNFYYCKMKCRFFVGFYEHGLTVLYEKNLHLFYFICYYYMIIFAVFVIVDVIIIIIFMIIKVDVIADCSCSLLLSHIRQLRITLRSTKAA